MSDAIGDALRAGDDAQRRAAMVLSDPHLPDCPMIAVNPAFCAVTGYGEEEFSVGRNCRFLQGSPDRSGGCTGADPQAVMAAGQGCIEWLVNHRKDGRDVLERAVHLPDARRERMARCGIIFGNQLDVTLGFPGLVRGCELRQSAHVVPALEQGVQRAAAVRSATRTVPMRSTASWPPRTSPGGDNGAVGARHAGDRLVSVGGHEHFGRSLVRRAGMYSREDYYAPGMTPNRERPLRAGRWQRSSPWHPNGLGACPDEGGNRVPGAASRSVDARWGFGCEVIARRHAAVPKPATATSSPTRWSTAVPRLPTTPRSPQRTRSSFVEILSPGTMPRPTPVSSWSVTFAVPSIMPLPDRPPDPNGQIIHHRRVAGRESLRSIIFERPEFVLDLPGITVTLEEIYEAARP